MVGVFRPRAHHASDALRACHLVAAGRCGAIVIVDVVCCGPVAIPAVGVHACARAIRSDPDGWGAAAVLQGVGHQIVQNPLQRITLALADRLAVVLEQLDGAIDTRCR